MQKVQQIYEEGMMMNEIQKELDQAYRLLATLPVRGDNVEIMASIRQQLRRAYALAESKDKGDEHGG